MLLAEELALAALSSDTGRAKTGTRTELNACPAGLIAGEVLLDGVLQRGYCNDCVVPKPGGPVPGSPALAAATEIAATGAG